MDRVLEAVARRLDGIPDGTKKTGYFASTRGIFSTATGNVKIITNALLK